ncbi:YeiH family protein [Tsuneonella flava]|nr:putative sulfate exporter family transporter [Tsuneonella flava]
MNTDISTLMGGEGWLPKLKMPIPGIVLCTAITVAAFLVEHAEVALAGRAWVEALVLAILIGTAIRAVWAPPARVEIGIGFSAKFLLEIAVVLLGASLSTRMIAEAGPALMIGIAVIIAVSIAVSLAIATALRLPLQMAILIACGNSICGNSAIAAVAPIIGADSDDVAASIAFTAVLGIGVVVGLPVIGAALGMSQLAFGALAGLTVYAVPQVIAATSSYGSIAVQAGTLVKLVRMLMLGPVCMALSLMAPRMARPSELTETAGDVDTALAKPRLSQLVPWFIVGFVVLALCRSAGLIPRMAIEPIRHIATLLTVVSMAGLGLGVDVRSIVGAGGRVTTAVILSLIGLFAMSFALIAVLHIA